MVRIKAKERIERYGLEKYLKSCRKQGMTKKRIEWYKAKYGDDIPPEKPKKVARPKRYKKSLWLITMEREGEVWKGVSSSALHAKSDHARDLMEAFMNAQKMAGESGWTLIDYEFLRYKKPYTEHYEYVEYHIPRPEERQTKIPEYEMKDIMEKVGTDPDQMKAIVQEMRKRK